MRKQKTPSEFGFTHHDIRRLRKEIKRTTDKRYYQRLQSVLWIAKGISAVKVRELTGSSLKSIYNYVNAYLSTHQTTSFCDAPRSGRPITASAITGSKIKKALQQHPLKLGYRVTSWTVAVLAAHLNKKYKCSIGIDTLRRRIKEMGLCFKRPRYVYVEKEPNRAQKKGRSCESYKECLIQPLCSLKMKR